MDIKDLQQALRYSDTATNKKALDSLLPAQQKVRSYGDEEIKSNKILATLQTFQSLVIKNRLMIHMSVNWPAGSEQKESATKQQLEEFANDFVIDNSNPGLKDWKTIRIAAVSNRTIIYEWNIAQWLELNFKTQKPVFRLPSTFSFKIHEIVPTFVFSRFGPNDLKKYISESFAKWIDQKDKESLFKNESTSFLKKIEMSLFITTVDLQKSEIRVGLRQSVIVAGFLAMTTIDNKKELDKKELDKIKKTIGSRVSNVSRLDRFIKGL